MYAEFAEKQLKVQRDVFMDNPEYKNIIMRVMSDDKITKIQHSKYAK